MGAQIDFNEARGRYEMLVDGYTVFANARREGSTLYIDYVEAPMALRGKGAASALMHEILDLAHAEDLKIVPICGYAAEWLRRHSNDYSL
ncbi:MAG: N-acetyltransferase [Alphaproteobacteria bacterium]|nr:N-acetyltransferase [Alphaproteobacteria bacterium]